MEQYKLGEMEQRFAELIWEHAPLSSRELTELCTESFEWKRTTTYTMLKRLCDRGIFENNNGTVEILIPKTEFYTMQGEEFLSNTFGGSLPRFFAAFTRRNKLTQTEIKELQQLIDKHKEG